MITEPLQLLLEVNGSTEEDRILGERVLEISVHEICNDNKGTHCQDEEALKVQNPVYEVLVPRLLLDDDPAPALQMSDLGLVSL